MFAHLHTHFLGSYSDSAMRIEEGIRKIKKMGQPAIALTDHGELAFAPPFYKSCLGQGIKPLIGCEIYFTEDAQYYIRHRLSERNHLILIAKNNDGYRNLIKIVNESWLSNCLRGRLGLVDWKLLQKYHKGLICLNACYFGSLPLKIIRQGEKAGEKELKRYLDLFGDDFYPELMNLGFPEQVISNKGLISLSKKYGLKPVITNDCHYPEPADWLAHDIIIKTRFGRPTDFSVGTKSIYLKSEEEMKQLGFPEEYLSNTREVADKCYINSNSSSTTFLPSFSHNPEEDVHQLEERCLYQIDRRFRPKDRAIYYRRYKKEIKTIKEDKLAGYLLLLSDFVNKVLNAGIPVCLGKNWDLKKSLTLYLLGVTSRGLTKHDLNKSLPTKEDLLNIEIVFLDKATARKYLIDQYGDKQICYQGLQVLINSRDALRHTGEVLRINRISLYRILKLVDEGKTIDENITANRTIRTFLQSHHKVSTLAKRIEGIPRRSAPSKSKMVFIPDNLMDWIPLKKSGEKIITQFGEKDMRGFGLLHLRIGVPDEMETAQTARSLARRIGKWFLH